MLKEKEGVLDPYKSKEVYNNWLKKKELNGINNNNTKIAVEFIKDMSLGLNIAKGSPKGGRSYKRLNALRSKLNVLFKFLENRGVKDIRKLTKREIFILFDSMRNGNIKTKKGSCYKCTGDYVKVFKTFWHWHQKVEKAKGKNIEDITEDLDTRGEKPKFVYFTKEDGSNIINQAEHDLKPLLALAFDSGARATELLNVKISDFSNDFKELNIREETSKTFGRKIKLMLCPKQIKEYVERNGLNKDDFLCKISHRLITYKLKELGKKVLTPEQTKFKNLSLYDFRHSSACYWLPIYKSESALKWRFGWKESEMIHYYTEFLGMKDTICEDDLYVDITKTELEKEMGQLKKQIEAMKIKHDKEIKFINLFNKNFMENTKLKKNKGKFTFDDFTIEDTKGDKVLFTSKTKLPDGCEDNKEMEAESAEDYLKSKEMRK